MKKWNFIIDVALCEDCNNCFLSCKDEHVGNDWPGYAAAQPLHGQRWMNIMRRERGMFPMVDVAYRPTPCMHCDNAPCIKAANNGAVYKRDDGIVIIDPDKAVGREDIVKACPYGAVWWNRELNLPQKCTFCAHLLDEGWGKTRCVQACPTGALRIIKIEDSGMKGIVESEKLEVLQPHLNTMPRVYYKNMYRFARCFIGGSLAYTKDGQTDCAQGAEVTLSKDSEIVATMVTDNFGDFKFDALGEDSGLYTLRITADGYEEKQIEVNLQTSLNLGTIML